MLRRISVIKTPSLLSWLIFGIGFLSVPEVEAQAFMNLLDFPGGNDGGNPLGNLVLSGSTLYGTANSGGSAGSGAVFAVQTDGSGFTILHPFTDTDDGAFPYAGVILSGNTLYGTTEYGGPAENGTVFALDTAGANFRTLYSFTAISGPFNTNSDGAFPEAGLLLSGSTLYGVTIIGGNTGNGTLFKINSDGSGFQRLHSFTGGLDGDYPHGDLIIAGNTLYGTAVGGGSSGTGALFALNTNGIPFTTLYSFTAVSGFLRTNNDGASPQAGLLLSGNTLYGTASKGGTFGFGSLFSIKTDGTGFTNLHNFTDSEATPYARLILSGGTLYGTTSGSSGSGFGTVFKLGTNGAGFTTLHGFTSEDGDTPIGGLVFGAGTLYGTASDGGAYDFGTVFSVALPMPTLAITRSGTNIILSWPQDFAEFALQSSTNLLSPGGWSAVSPSPDIVNGQNTVTNSASGISRFYRLKK
jgi:uncharacterized repeat protein (TIGR03803 family)